MSGSASEYTSASTTWCLWQGCPVIPSKELSKDCFSFFLLPWHSNFWAFCKNMQFFTGYLWKLKADMPFQRQDAGGVWKDGRWKLHFFHVPSIIHNGGVEMYRNTGKGHSNILQIAGVKLENAPLAKANSPGWEAQRRICLLWLSEAMMLY